MRRRALILRGVLLFLVRFYRRRLSGRGPLARVRCTFAGMESCAAFAERILIETPSTLQAVRRILRRLSRCRHLSLYRLPSGRLGWGSDYDAVLTASSPLEGARRLENSLAEDGEGGSVRAAVHRAAALVTVAAATVPHQAAAAPLPVVRDSNALQQTFRRRFRGHCLLAAFALTSGTIAWLGDCGALVVVVCLIALLGFVRARSAQAVLRRLEWLEVLASIEGPGASVAPGSSEPHLIANHDPSYTRSG